MKIICVSASNIEGARANSASTQTCKIIRDLIHTDLAPEAEVEILPLIDYEPIPCRMCGKCYKTERCAHDPAFNKIFEKLVAADGAFFVSPHYAPIPSKLVMLFEKLEEMVYLNSCDDPLYRFPLYKKPVGIVAHGGQTDDTALSYYKTALLDPIATALTAVQMQVIGANEQWPYGVAFGVKDIHKQQDCIFVDIEHNWDVIRERITPLVRNVVARVVN